MRVDPSETESGSLPDTKPQNDGRDPSEKREPWVDCQVDFQVDFQVAQTPVSFPASAAIISAIESRIATEISHILLEFSPASGGRAAGERRARGGRQAGGGRAAGGGARARVSLFVFVKGSLFIFTCLFHLL